MALSNNISISLSSVLSKTVGLAEAVATISQSINNTLSDTTDVYATQVTLTGIGTPDTIDLSGTLEDPLGDTVAFTSIMLVLVINNGTNPVVIGNNVNNIAFLDPSDEINVGGSSTVLIADPNGKTVTNASTDILQLEGTAADTVDVVVIGTTA